MESNPLASFTQTVLADSSLPAWVWENIGSARGVEEVTLDQSYLDFLDTQIDLSPRGPEWTKVLQKRRAALANYCGKRLVHGIVSEGRGSCYIKIDPLSKSILYWELWNC